MRLPPTSTLFPYTTLFRSFHGRWPGVTVKVRPSGPVQLLEGIGLIVQMRDHDSPFPDFNLHMAFEDEQVSLLPVFLSVSVVVPDLPVIDPPGLTVQVAATA